MALAAVGPFGMGGADLDGCGRAGVAGQAVAAVLEAVGDGRRAGRLRPLVQGWRRRGAPTAGTESVSTVSRHVALAAGGPVGVGRARGVLAHVGDIGSVAVARKAPPGSGAFVLFAHGVGDPGGGAWKGSTLAADLQAPGLPGGGSPQSFPASRPRGEHGPLLGIVGGSGFEGRIRLLGGFGRLAAASQTDPSQKKETPAHQAFSTRTAHFL